MEPENVRIGHVYVISDILRGYVKIGKSINPEERVDKIITFLGLDKNKVYISKEVINMGQLETYTHKYFENFRIKGEWFKVPFDEAVSVVNKASLIFSRETKKEYQEYLERKKITDADKSEALKKSLSALFKNKCDTCFFKIFDGKESIEIYWGNWIDSEDLDPPKTGSDIFAYNLNGDYSCVVYWDGDKFVDDGKVEFVGVDYWQPIISPMYKRLGGWDK